MKQNTETKRILGPWNLWPTHWAGGSNAVKVDGINTVWIDSPAGEIARLHPHNGRIDDLVYARARLIAEAPAMLEACEAIIALERSTAGKGLLDLSATELLACYQKAKAAIRKAKGEA